VLFPSTVSPGSLKISISKGFNWCTRQPCNIKFSAHVIVRHSTCMFQNHHDMMVAITCIQQTRWWSHLKTIVHLSVYGKSQLFHTPGYTNAPSFEDPSCIKNILLPINSGTANVMATWLRHPTMTFDIWKRHLVTSFETDQRAPAFTGTNLVLLRSKGCIQSSDKPQHVMSQ
jgi:hypothetical protein